MRIAILGAGIGGLAAAVSLEAAGFRDITIYERAREIRGLGVGINLLPHALRELTELGVAPRIERIGVAPRTLSYYTRRGQRIWTEPRGLDAGYAWPQVSVHRGWLQLELLQLVRERLGDVIRLDHQFVGIDSGGDDERMRFTTGDGEVEASADVVVGADGIHSTLRRIRYPEHSGPQWSGLTLWRGTARVAPFLDGSTMIMAGDGVMRFVAYPISDPDDSGLVTLNFIAEQRGPGNPGADWNRSVPSEPIVELFRDWTFDWLDVPGIIAAADELLEYPMVDLDPVLRWSFGRTTLLGDAAHAMYPNGSNGASQAIIDGRVLAMHLATAGDAAEALRRYDDARRPAMDALLRGNRSGGPERVMQLAYDRAPDGFDDIDDVIPHDELVEAATSFKRAAGFEPAQLNARESFSVAAVAR